jgi:hypothetical protein
MQTIPADKVIVHIVGTVSESRARRDAAKQSQAAVEERPFVLDSLREVLGLQSGPSMRESLGLAA